jgi:hypothetical protein
MISKCECQHCAGAIEFEAADLERTGETPYRVLGQNIDCPHCGQVAQLYLPRHAITSSKNVPTEKNNIAVAIILFSGGCSIVGVVAERCGLFGESDLPLSIMLGILGIPIYFLPTIVGWKKRNREAIFILNFCLGWTFLGWVIALVWAKTVDSPAAKN